ncbi:MAG TPA: ECF-type sigma factor [Rhodanobacteraceae bacterium]
MAGADRSELTGLLARWGDGDVGSRERALALVYAELQRMAAGLIGGGRRVTLQTTALVNEALIKMLGADSASFENRAHFFGVAARAMRQILVDHARRRAAAKRGNGSANADTLDDFAVAGTVEVDLLALDDAMRRLEALDAQQVRIVELRYFVGFSIEETAAVLGLHPSAVNREWAMARAWLRNALAP